MTHIDLIHYLTKEYYNSIVEGLTFAIILIMTDFLTGMWASFKIKKPIISSKLKRTIEKLVLYFLAIILSYIFGNLFLGGTLLGTTTCGFIASIELLSIYENIRLSTGLNIGDKVKNLFNSILPKKDDKINNNNE